MKIMLPALIIVTGIISLLLAVGLTEYTTTVTIRYDCRRLIGGWHPDVPGVIQEQCRKLKGN